MNKQDFINMTTTGGLIAEDRRLFLTCFNEDGEIEDKDAFIEFCMMKLQLQTTLRIQGLNEKIASGIHELGLIGQWTNLLQIHRSLPDCVKDAVRNEGSFEKDIKDWVKRQKKWDGLAAAQQALALEFVEEEEQKHVEPRMPSEANSEKGE